MGREGWTGHTEEKVTRVKERSPRRGPVGVVKRRVIRADGGGPRGG